MTITVELMGGLGNQLFQYAFARSLAVARDTNIRLDVTWYRQSDDRTFMLDRYRLIERRDVDIVDARRTRALRKAYYVVARHSRGRLPGLPITEPNPGFYPRLLDIPRNSRLIGYWQHEGYFRSVADQIKDEFILREELTPERTEVARRLSQARTVAIHVRLGDYQTNPATAAFHGSCGYDYYRSAMHYFDRLFGQPYYYLFSDDSALARQFLTGPNIYLVDTPRDGHDEQDLYLMSLASGHIIANSSFSWWGAWLSQSRNKVIAPHPWLLERKWNDFSPVPPTWTLISRYGESTRDCDAT